MSDDEFILEDDLDVIEILDYGFPREVRERPNYFEELDEFSFFKRFRLYKETALYVLSLIEDDLEYPTDAFYASSGHLSSTADYMNIHVSTASRIIIRGSEAIARLFPNVVKMPTPNELIKEQNKFYSIAKFPRIIGIVDGTHVRIQSPGGNNAEVYRNRKGYFSINVQVVGNADLKFLDVVARWPGSAHDSTIFSNSNIRMRFERSEFRECILLGDSAYPLRTFFLTPLGNPITRQQQLYNESLIRSRNLIERLIGVWKRRFPIVAYGMRIKEETSKIIIVATTVLHNIARDMNEPDPPFDEQELNWEEITYLIETGDIPAFHNQDNAIGAQQVQAEIINYFNRVS